MEKREKLTKYNHNLLKELIKRNKNFLQNGQINRNERNIYFIYPKT